MNFNSIFLKLNKKYFIITIIAALVIILSGYFIFFRNAEIKYDFVLAKRGNLSQEVSVTGHIKPVDDVGLAFEKNGKIENIYVNIGDKVSMGQKLVRLNNDDISAQLTQVEAGVESAKAALLQYKATLEREKVKLDELKIGTRSEEIKILEAKVESTKKSFSDAIIDLENVKIKAETDLSNLYGDIKDILNDAYAKSEDAVNKQTDELFDDDLTSNPNLSFLTTNSQSEAEYKRLQITGELKAFKSDIDNLPIDQSSLNGLLIKSKDRLSIVRDFLIIANDALNGAVNVSQANITAYKTNVATGRTNVNTAISNITTQQQLITSQKNTNQSNTSSAESQMNSAQNTLAVAEAELNLKKAGATFQQIAAQEAQVGQAEANVVAGEAQVRQAQANVKNYQAQLSKTVIISPIDGVVAKQNGKVGEIISANAIIVSVISDVKFEIKANIPEADIARVHIDNSASVNLDAHPDIFFDAKVTSIDPAETIIEGVATYEITLRFVKEDGGIKSGMTANIDILSEKKENAISIPQRSIISKNKDKFVKILKNDKAEEVKIITGIKGMNGYIEVIDGVKEGDKIIILEK